MIKHYGRENKGFAKANQNRTERAITRRYGLGERPSTNKQLAEMMDRAYGTGYIELFHTKKEKK